MTQTQIMPDFVRSRFGDIFFAVTESGRKHESRFTKDSDGVERTDESDAADAASIPSCRADNGACSVDKIRGIATVNRIFARVLRRYVNVKRRIIFRYSLPYILNCILLLLAKGVRVAVNAIRGGVYRLTASKIRIPSGSGRTVTVKVKITNAVSTETAV